VVTLLFINISMAYRKHFEQQLETDIAYWGNTVEFYMVDSDCANFACHLVHQNNIYEITYSDLGQITLSEFPKKHWPNSTIREIYVGDHSAPSYQCMLSLLADNFNTSLI